MNFLLVSIIILGICATIRTTSNQCLSRKTPRHTHQEFDVMMALFKIKKTATGPDGLPFWVWRDNCTTLAPVVTALWNKSLSSYTWPTAWKGANINPLPKVATPVQYSVFRGINVTPVKARCFERTVYHHYSKKVFEENLTVKQYA